MEFQFSTYEQFVNGLCQVNWLDPSDKPSEEEKKRVLTLLWNFSVEQEQKEEELSIDREIGESLDEENLW